MTTPADVGRPFTVEDLEAMPDDGCRYELVDGAMLVSPAPGWAHQEALGRLYILLRMACPANLCVILAPFSVRQDQFNEVQPDLLVGRLGDMTEKNLPRPPVLAIEIISPTSRLGVRSYWLVDPVKPALTAFELRGTDYAEIAYVAGDEGWQAVEPFAVAITPAELIRGV